MGTLKRGIKNVFRNKSRNIAIILILSLSLSLALMMINMDFSSNLRIKEIEEKYGNTIGVEKSENYVKSTIDKKKGSDAIGTLYCDESIADDILKIDSVKSVDKSLIKGFSSKKLIARRLVESYDKCITTGVDEVFDNYISLFSANERQIKDLKLLEGNFFKETDIDQNIALIEKNFAERNHLKVDSDIIINGEKIKVCGVYEFKYIEFNPVGDIEAIFAPLKTVQRLFDLEGKISSSFIVTVDSIDNVQKTVDYINNVIIDGALEAQPLIEYFLFFHSGNMIKKISKVSVISSFMVATVIILSVMFVNVRNRAREIGILKAIGASNINISAQFLIESLTICIIALTLSIFIVLIANQVIADFIIESEKSSLTESGDYIDYSEEMSEEDIERLKEALSIEEVPDEFEWSDRLKIIFTPQILLLAILLTLLLAAIGSLIPAFYISKLRPAEVLRFG